MFPQLLTIFTASLLGGALHCTGMCGAFVGFAIGMGDPKIVTPRWMLQALYHLGRLITYVALGAIAGAVGGTLNLAGATVGLQYTAAIIAGGMMILFGLASLARLTGAKVPTFPVPKFLSRAAAAGHARAARWPAPMRALAIGLLTTLLPCGFLYMFVFTAAGTGHALTGALFMAVFWLGTVPALVSLGAILQLLGARLGLRLPAALAVIVVIMGIYTIHTRLNAAPRIAEKMATKAAATQSAATQAAMETLLDTPECCRHESKR